VKCKICGVEMSVDKVVRNDDSETFVYKCRNPACSKYGYKKSDKQADDNSKTESGDK